MKKISLRILGYADAFQRELPLKLLGFWLILLLVSSAQLGAQPFVHPGIWYKRSALDRMKYMVLAERDPWKNSYERMKIDPLPSFTYVVRKSPTNHALSRENPCDQCGQFESDARAAYLNSLLWYITGDQRHASKTIEILNAWGNLTKFYGGGTEPLSAGIYVRHLVNAAEIIQHTQAGWAQADIDKFKAMLVYPGYSNTTVPTAAIANKQVTFYWNIYRGDPGRHGNQDLIPMLAMMEMGFFLENPIIYDRGFRYLKGLPHRSDDLPYADGPPVNTFSKSTTYYDEYTSSLPASPSIPEDYGYNGVLTNYIWENGQLQENSRDQSHCGLGLGMYGEAAEVAWNQGADMYSLSTNRILKGMEYSLRYNTSFTQAFSDQPSPWEPTVESGEFIQRADRTGRWFSKKINPWNGEDYTNLTRGKSHEHPAWEMAVAHYGDRVGVVAKEMKWTRRTRDLGIERLGYEGNGFKLDVPGWGGLTFRRPSLCPGDPCFFVDGKPVYRMIVLPGTVEAEDYDHFQGGGQGKTYYDQTPNNSGGQYRTGEGVDVLACSEGGYQVSEMDLGEWLNYTVAVPTSGIYQLRIRYAATNGKGKIRFAFDGKNVSGDVSVPFGGMYSTGPQHWKDFTVALQVPLQAGVQSMRIFVLGAERAFSLNLVRLEATAPTQPPTAPSALGVKAGYEQASLKWEPYVGATSYTVKRASLSTGPYTTEATGLTTNRYVNRGLANGTTYFYVVSVSNDVGEGKTPFP